MFQEKSLAERELDLQIIQILVHGRMAIFLLGRMCIRGLCRKRIREHYLRDWIAAQHSSKEREKSYKTVLKPPLFRAVKNSLLYMILKITAAANSQNFISYELKYTITLKGQRHLCLLKLCITDNFTLLYHCMTL